MSVQFSPETAEVAGLNVQIEDSSEDSVLYREQDGNLSGKSVLFKKEDGNLVINDTSKKAASSFSVLRNLLVDPRY
eukprot:2180498-Rhodomonas_salina.6